MQAFSRLNKPLHYDIFLSFRGPDSRYTFTGNLYKALDPPFRFRTFMDDREINKGFEITENLLKAIRMSRIFIIVLSKNFASSRACVMEVVHIFREFKKGKGRVVLPVFYDVDPTHLADTYCVALDEGRIIEDMREEWLIALTKLSEFHHFHINTNENIPEYEHIDNILKEVSRHVTHPVGICSRMLKVDKLLSSGSDPVCVIGVCGKAGIGKTTVVQEVYNFNANQGFDYCCLFYDGEEISPAVLSKLNGKKVFIVFEDIKDSEQLKNIKKLIEQLGSGSKLIITAENRDFLKRDIQIYDVESLSPTEATTLLVNKAFNSKTITTEYVDIVNQIQTCALGHPQTLELISSKLSGKSFEECESASSKYESMTDRCIRKIPEEIFKDLTKHQQDMLIDIASDYKELIASDNCKELELIQVEAKFHSKYQHCPRRDIRVLLDTSLIKINQHGQLTLHTSTLEMIEDEVKARKHGHGQS